MIGKWKITKKKNTAEKHKQRSWKFKRNNISTVKLQEIRNKNIRYLILRFKKKFKYIL